MAKRWTLNDIEAKGLSYVKITGTQNHTITLPNLAEIKPDVPRGRSKFGNVKTDGFDSKREAAYYKILKLNEKAGLVTAIQTQVVFQLSVCKYIADFVYFDIPAGAWVVADAKGMRTKEYILKSKMMLNELKIKILEV